MQWLMWGNKLRYHLRNPIPIDIFSLTRDLVLCCGGEQKHCLGGQLNCMFSLQETTREQLLDMKKQITSIKTREQLP